MKLDKSCATRPDNEFAANKQGLMLLSSNRFAFLGGERKGQFSIVVLLSEGENERLAHTQRQEQVYQCVGVDGEGDGGTTGAECG